jgi:hypothetical protein
MISGAPFRVASAKRHLLAIRAASLEPVVIYSAKIALISSDALIACFPPQWVQARTRLSTFSGYFRAISWAIIPPIERESIWALKMPRASIRPTVSSAIIEMV